MMGRFTFDEIQTLEIQAFCKDFVVKSFDLHSSTLVLDMMRDMSFLPGFRGRLQIHGTFTQGETQSSIAPHAI
ncbi:hypothetical protein CK203_083599 [Vitis vinifera]|uniref:Uncharacterized protein n=1 Tax=Vitis vinifera TaxID=29760 RepID=A0A438BS73_VITVI|nr:hypothetical protein CK203_083599 [Vitis vinifera]